MFTWSKCVYFRSFLTETLKQIITGHRSGNFTVNMARTVKLDNTDLRSQAVLASESLSLGHVIAVPTDTIYGVAVLAQNSKAVNKLFDVKKRHIEKAVAISVGDTNDVYKWGKVTVSREVLNDLLPGPVTVIFDRTPELNPSLNQGTLSVGIRIPDHEFVRRIAQECDQPIALTSANISSEQSPLSITEFKSLWSDLDLVFDGGQLGDTEESRLGSTVVDLTQQGHFKIIREGSAYKNTVNLLSSKHNLKEIRR